MMYSEKVLDHFTNPRNVGELPDANGVGEVGNAKCGDIMKMYLKIEGGIITDVRFKTFGCGAAIATSSMATEMVKGKTVEEALQLSNKAVMEALDGLPPVKVHCSVLAEQAVRAALSDYYTRQGIDPEPIVGKIQEVDHHPAGSGCDSCSLNAPLKPPLQKSRQPKRPRLQKRQGRFSLIPGAWRQHSRWQRQFGD